MSDTTGVGASSTSDPGGSSGPEVPTGGAAPTTGDPGTSASTSTSTSTGGDATSTTGDGTSTSTSTGSSQTSGDATGPGGTSSGDAATGPPPRLYDCFGCDCDADTTFCRKVFAGVVAVEDPPLCPVVEADGLESGCVVYPRGCDPPSCACLPLMNNNCFCNESERLPGAFEVTCPLP